MTWHLFEVSILELSWVEESLLEGWEQQQSVFRQRILFSERELWVSVWWVRAAAECLLVSVRYPLSERLAA